MPQDPNQMNPQAMMGGAAGMIPQIGQQFGNPNNPTEQGMFGLAGQLLGAGTAFMKDGGEVPSKDINDIKLFVLPVPVPPIAKIIEFGKIWCLLKFLSNFVCGVNSSFNFSYQLMIFSFLIIFFLIGFIIYYILENNLTNPYNT